MALPTTFSLPSGDVRLADLELPLGPETLLPEATGPWEVELGFGKGRYLLRRAMEEPAGRFLGIEIASKYQRLLANRARKRNLRNLVAVRGEALHLLGTVLPREMARVVHVYFPDPWPKARHHKRRLFDPETVDLVIGLLEPGGELQFASDHLEYAAEVIAVLEGTPGLEIEHVDGPWPEGARTNWEAKFEKEGRPIRRLKARRVGGVELHPAGREALLVGPRPPRAENDGSSPEVEAGSEAVDLGRDA